MKIKKIRRGNAIWLMICIPIPNIRKLLIPIIQIVKSLFSLSKYAYNVFLIIVCLVLLFGLIKSWALFMSTLSANHPEKATHEQLVVKIDAKNLITELKIGKKTEYYEVNKIPNSEMIDGKKGDYFVIDIKDAITTEVIHFKAGKYIIDDLEKQFSESITRFYKDIWQELKNEGKAEIFIKGSADISGNTSFRDKIVNVDCQKDIFTSIPVYPLDNKASNRYRSNPITKFIQSGEYTNKDLPNLRARFMQCKLREAYPDINPKILEGSVTPEEGEEYRNVWLILFIDSK